MPDQWWRLYQDPNLNTAVEQALTHHVAIGIVCRHCHNGHAALLGKGCRHEYQKPIDFIKTSETSKDRQMTSRTISTRMGIGSTAKVFQSQALLTSGLSLDETALILIRRGSKQVGYNGHEYHLNAGDALLVSADTRLDVTNLPATPAEGYEADWLSFPNHIIEGSDARALAISSLSHGFIDAFYHAVAAIKDHAGISDKVAEKRLEEVMLWLEERGIALRLNRVERLTQKVRRMIASEIAKEWTAEEVAHSLAMSESTLRRKLSAENAAFQQLLADVRMCHALTLLQVTDRAISQIAYDVGYESPSKFSTRFRLRFGFNPGQVRTQLIASQQAAIN
ncbi:AraC family transcriptional regulator [Candidatus Pantoea formicae]|uniref:helix-turn-helix transcriptional regulator n=1 Tax=Candidatus Pantoea formicae TaxID=2608355 RepID=UPI003EDB22BC